MKELVCIEKNFFWGFVSRKNQKPMEDANNGIGVILTKPARDRALYKTDKGLVDMVQVCRDYVKSVFGTKAAECRQVTKIKFRDLPKEEKDKL